MPPIIPVAEQRIADLLLQPEHFWLMAGIFGFIYVLRAVTPLANIIFSKKWNWIIPILNFGLSVLGIFVLKMTTATTTGMKLVIAILISAITSYGYELLKPLIQKLFGKFFGGDQKTEDKPTS